MLDKYGTGQDPYCYPNSDVLINKLDIRDASILAAAEVELTTLARPDIPTLTPPYTLDSLRTIHHQLFSDLYDWAGEVRTIDISKGETRFCNFGRIEPEAEKLFRNIDYGEALGEMPRRVFIDTLAEFYCELNMVHPFRDGNGRAQRILLEHMVSWSGGTITLPDDAERWLQANVAGVHCNYSLMAELFEEAITLD